MKTINILCFLIAICITACKKPVSTMPVTQTDSTKTDPPDNPKPVVKPDSIVKVVYSGEGTHWAMDNPSSFYRTFPAEMTVTVNYTDSTIAFQGNGEIAVAFSTWFELNKEHTYAVVYSTSMEFRLIADSLYAANGKTTGIGGEWYKFEGKK